VAKIPKGFVASYSQIAEVAGSKNYVRAVGNALHVNPYPREKVPCHRVVKSNGDIGGYANGALVKMNMLIGEGVEIVKGKVNLKKHLVNIELLK
jgi:methylated-DNA-[protein]-cysteine S-methyltransferase